MPANVHQLTWVNPTQNTDGSAYDAATENAGYDLAIDGTVPSLSLPFAFGNEFQLDAATQAYADLVSGTHNLRLRVVNREGLTSDWTPPASFRKVGIPNPPHAVALA